MASNGKNILYAEDDPNDVIIFKMGFGRATLPHTLHVVDDGQAAIDWLSGKDGFKDRKKFPMPEVVIVDLKMPKKKTASTFSSGFAANPIWKTSRSLFLVRPMTLATSNAPILWGRLLTSSNRQLSRN